MFEVTWPEAIAIAKGRLDRYTPTQLYVIYNGAKGDFASLQSTGIVGWVTQDNTGGWFVDDGTAHVYPADSETVWVG